MTAEKNITSSAADVDAIMKKYDRESNQRIWTGKPKMVIRLTSFLALIVLMGFLIYPAKKGEIRENYMPWYDIIFMLLGTGSFLESLPMRLDLD